jgi:hypothetical protein
MLQELTFFQGGILGLNTAAVLLLYKMHRDIGDVRRALHGVQREHWEWIDRLRVKVWPELFKHRVDHPPPPTEPL